MKATKDITRYVVLGLGRSGTTAVHFALKGHPNVSALNDEVKVSFFSNGISSFTQRDDNANEKSAGSLHLFDAITGIFADEKTLAYGLKCVPSDVENTGVLVESLRKYYPDIKIILLRRNDLTAQYGSMLRAEMTGEWHSWRVKENTENVRVKISKSQFRKYLKNSVAKFNLLQDLKNSHELVLVDYEQTLLGKEHPDFSAVFKFLELPDLRATWLDCAKVAPPPEDYIVNYDKMHQVFEEYA